MLPLQAYQTSGETDEADEPVDTPDNTVEEVATSDEEVKYDSDSSTDGEVNVEAMARFNLTRAGRVTRVPQHLLD